MHVQSRQVIFRGLDPLREMAASKIRQNDSGQNVYDRASKR
jgi:hypothetical protein